MRDSTTFGPGKGTNNNPVINGLYADPDIIYSRKKRKFYIYPTTDGFKGWGGTSFKAFSSKDMKTWKDEGVILDLEEDVSWADKKAWAPCILEKKINGKYKYFFYFTAEGKIGVATSDKPGGPFKDIGKPLIDKLPPGVLKGHHIDPDVFVDPVSGKTYLYWGNTYMAVAELNDDMISLNEGTIKVLTPKNAGYGEATTVFFRKGRYYFMWSQGDTRKTSYKVRYGISDSPDGKIELPQNNVLLQTSAEKGIYATGHNSVIQLPGSDDWFIVYHRFKYPNGITMGEDAGYNREICIDRLDFNEDGTLKEVVPTHTGITIRK